MPTFKTTLILLGLEVNVEAEWKLVNAGSPPSYSPIWGADGGDPDEIEIEEINIGGKDYTELLKNCYMFDEYDKYTGFSFEPVAYMTPEKQINYRWQDEVRIALFGLSDHPFYGHGKTLPIQTNVRYVGDTVYERIERKILESQALQDHIGDLYHSGD